MEDGQDIKPASDGDLSLDPDPNHPKAVSISAIDKASVHRICSGQVVLTLATAVKELVENSVDAGATIVDVKLKEYGADSIEVSDNGFGVEQKNFKGLTLKHHTSKLQDFGDLINVETFGFRGEALSSLCALGDMSITTRHKDTTVGTKLEFDHHGNITKETPQARQVGTTVMLQNLFYTLPVRHKEFQRNLKKEFVKMVQVLNSYCIISVGVRITCTNITGKGSRSTVISTKGNATLRENISNIFGPKQVQSLMEFKQKTPEENDCTEFGIKATQQNMFRIEGYVSKCDHGQGRSSADRQFYFINGRPFDSSKLVKVVHEVYHQYNRHQYPFVVLIIKMEKDAVDVNVTPDKRQVFLQGEKLMLATIKSSLVAMYEPTSSIVQIHLPASLSRSSSLRSTESADSGDTRDSFIKNVSSTADTKKESSLSRLKRTFSSAFAKSDSESETESKAPNMQQDRKQRRMDSFVRISSMGSYSPKTADEKNSASREATVCHSVNCELSAPFDGSDSPYASVTHGREFKPYPINRFTNPTNPDTDSTQVDSNSEDLNSSKTESNYESDSVFNSQRTESSIGKCGLGLNDCDTDCTLTFSEDEYTTKGISSGNSQLQIVPHTCFDKYSQDKDSAPTEGGEAETNAFSSPSSRLSSETVCTSQLETNDCQVTFHHVDEREEVKRSERKVNFSLSALKRHITQSDQPGTSGVTETGFSRNFRATITPTDNQAAEQELQKEIKKEMFGEMEILGQFNLGFIITKLGDDLFIVDQHATDEKFNFETLQRDTVIQSQKLISPMNLELTASSETILVDNLDIFKKNGFEFIVDEEAPPTQRVKLTSTPVSKNWNFGKEDIEEMIFMLTVSPGVTCRPSRVRQMFASRACRKSVMIGTALNKSEMKKLVSHMGEIDQPWNCPHGRPTMRHLISLNMVPR